jgi:hypothetical protein
MNHQPPLDQRIVDEYFRLASSRKTKDIAWLYAMVATYGLKPDELSSFEWNSDSSISIASKKRRVRPFHPQWVFLFELKEKQPHNLQSCYSSLTTNLYQSMAFQQIKLNVTDLILAHKLRKNHYKQIKQPLASCPAYAVAS